MPSGFARSLSRRLSRAKKRRSTDSTAAAAASPPPPNPPPVQDAMALASSTTSMQNKSGLISRGMDRIRRSLRIRRGRGEGTTSGGELVRGGESHELTPDDAAVRAGLCSFNVKYLGSVEVFESRGMQVCEGALKLLRAQTKNPVKAVLYVSGDGLRLVDQQNNRGLLVDQTIEKGERLSHAVGCAFTVCLEKKKKRDEDVNVPVEKALNPNWGDANSGGEKNGKEAFARNTVTASFRRQLSIQERISDPQTAILAETPQPAPGGSKPQLQTIAKPRPHANRELFNRQGSLRAPAEEQNGQFKRQYSLRAYELPSKMILQRSEVIAEIDEGDSTLLLPDIPPPSDHQLTGHNNSVFSPYQTTPGLQTSESLHNNNHNTLGSWSQQSWPTNGSQAPAGEKSVPTTGPPPGLSSPTESALRSSVVHRPAAPSRSLADEWLNGALRQSLSLSSPPPPPTREVGEYRSDYQPQHNHAVFSEVSGPPPSHPPPPLPPNSILTFSNQPISSDMFKESNSSARVLSWSSRSTSSQSESTVPVDPFDVRWSRLTMTSQQNGAQPRSLLL